MNFCDKCSSTKNVKGYRFYSGKHLHTNTQETHTQSITRTSYRLHHIHHSAFICNSCALKRQIWNIIQIIAGSLIFGLIIAVLWNMFILKGGKIDDNGLLKLAIFFSVFGFIYGIKEIGLFLNDAAEGVAIEIHEKALKSKGFDSFFRTRDYNKLERH